MNWYRWMHIHTIIACQVCLQYKQNARSIEWPSMVWETTLVTYLLAVYAGSCSLFLSLNRFSCFVWHWSCVDYRDWRSCRCHGSNPLEGHAMKRKSSAMWSCKRSHPLVKGKRGGESRRGVSHTHRHTHITQPIAVSTAALNPWFWIVLKTCNASSPFVPLYYNCSFFPTIIVLVAYIKWE